LAVGFFKKLALASWLLKQWVLPLIDVLTEQSVGQVFVIGETPRTHVAEFTSRGKNV
jgi:hypothetical protein